MTEWSDIKPKDDIRVEVEAADLRALVDTIIRKSPAVADRAFPSPDMAQAFLSEMTIAHRLWLASMLHQGQTITLDNQVFTAFMKLAERADYIGADLELPEKLQRLLDNLPMPDEEIRPLGRSPLARS